MKLVIEPIKDAEIMLIGYTTAYYRGKGRKGLGFPSVFIRQVMSLDTFRRLRALESQIRTNRSQRFLKAQI